MTPADSNAEPTRSPESGDGMLKKLLSLISDSATYGLSSVMTQLVQFLLLPVYTRYLSPADNGVIAMLVIVTLLFGPLANLGVTNAVFRRLNQAKDEESSRIVLGTGLFSVALGALVCLIAALVFARWIAAEIVGDAATTPLVQWVLLAAAINTVAQIPNVTLRARRRVKTAATLNLVGALLSIVTTIVFVVGLEMGVYGWVYGMLVASVIFLVVGLVLTRNLFAWRMDAAMWRSMLSYGLPFVPHRLQAVALAQFSTYMVREMLGLDEAGIYAIAAKFALPVGVIVNAVQEAWVPFKFQIHAQEADARPFFRSIFTYYVAAVSYLWVGVSLWGFDVVRLMTASDYHAAAFLVPLLALLRVAQGVYFMLSTGIELSERTGVYPLISLAGLATVVGSAYVLVDPLGPAGAAWASVLCWSVMAAIMYVLAQRRYGINYDWTTIACFALLSSVCVACGYAVQSAPLWTRLGVYLAISLAYPLAGLLLLGRSPLERERLRILLVRFGIRRRPAVSHEIVSSAVVSQDSAPVR